MNGYDFTFRGERLTALAAGALLWPEAGVLCVSDLHLGKSERVARRGGSTLPPYETQDTLARLDHLLDLHDPGTVICLGDSFDDSAAASALSESQLLWLARMQAGRRWIWIEGNHDPGPLDLGGEHLSEMRMGPVIFRHIAVPGATGEVSGHYHPKASLRGRARPAFLLDTARLILPAFGTYTGGLRSQDAALSTLMGEGAVAILTGTFARAIPMPR